MNYSPDFEAHLRVTEMLLPCGCEAYLLDGRRSTYHQALCLLRLAEGRAADEEVAGWMEEVAGWMRERNERWVREHPWRTEPS